MFTKGNTYGKHNNHQRAGRLTNEQRNELAGLLPKSIECYKYILEKKSDSIEWHRLKAEVASKLFNKFVADLQDLSGDMKITGADLIGEFLDNVRKRSSEATKGSPDRAGDSGDNGAVQG